MDAPYLNVEDPYQYTPGGYHPVDINDELYNNRYRILHKLGHGTSSTVWLALNQDYGQPGAPHLHYVALKIQVASASLRLVEGSILRQLGPPPPAGWLAYVSSFWSRRSDDIPRHEFVPALLDEFDIIGPNGMHHCVVTEVLGPCVVALKFSGELLPLEVARKATVQCVKAMRFLHSYGVVHGGNITLGIPAIDSWTVDELYERLGKPSKIPVPFDSDIDSDIESDGTNHESEEEDLPLSPPQFAVPPIDAAKLWESCNKIPTVHIIDFGEAWVSHIQGSPLPAGRRIPGTPKKMAPPEILAVNFLEEVGRAADVWTLACTIFELFGNRSLFIMIWGGTNEVIADIVAVLGRLPERWWRAWRMRAGFGKNWYTEEGELNDDHGRQRRELTLEERVRTVRGTRKDTEYLAESDREALVGILRAALKLEPKERATAEELLAKLPVEWEKGKVAGSKA